MDMGDRDAKDLKDDNLSVFQFRDYTVIRLNKADKRLTFGENANHCFFINEDLELMANFLLECKKFREGVIEDVKNVLVY